MKEWVELYMFGSIMIVFDNMCKWLGSQNHALWLLITIIIVSKFVIDCLIRGKREHIAIMKCRKALYENIKGVADERDN